MSFVVSGGCAFPCEQHETTGGAWNQTFDPGMSLRDWFAGQALSGILTKMEGTASGFSEVGSLAAKAAYAIADAMIAERAK